MTEKYDTDAYTVAKIPNANEANISKISRGNGTYDSPLTNCSFLFLLFSIPPFYYFFKNSQEKRISTFACHKTHIHLKMSKIFCQVLNTGRVA